MARAAAGDSAAFAHLYDRYAAVLLATALRMVGSRDANDVLHDVFLEAWRSASDYDQNRGSVRTWLLVRLRSRSLDRMDRAEQTRTRPLEDEDEQIPLSAGPGAPHGAALDRIAVQRALEALPSDVRGALEASYFQGLTAREIAEYAGVPLGTIKSRLARGLAALERLLGTADGEPHAG